MSIATKLKSGETEYDIRDADAQERLITAEKKIKTLEETVAGGEGKTIFTAEYESKLEGIEAGAQVNTVTGVKGSSESTYRKGNINITKTNIGLGNVDNTSDKDKPISTAVQEALNGKLDSDDISSDAYDFLACISEPASLTFKIDGAAFNPYEWNTLAVTTVTVASATSRHASVTDYQCNGTNDTEMFQAAINSLPSSGGKITILEGTYTITSPLSVSKSVVFEGMGAGTVINCTNHSFLNNTSDSADITIRDCKFNLTGTLSGAEPFIYSAGNLTVESCIISATTSSFAPTENSEEDASILSSFADYINGRKNVSVTNCKITVTVPSGSTGDNCSAFIHNQSLGSRVKVSKCDISMTINSNAVANLYFMRSGVLSDCNIMLNNDVQGLNGLYLTDCDHKSSSVTFSVRRQEQNITGCLIYATGAVSYGENYCGITPAAKKPTGTFSGNAVIYLGDTYCNFSTVSGNGFIRFAKYGRSGNLYFYGNKPVVKGNRIDIAEENSVKGDDGIIYTNNMQSKAQTVTTSSTAIIANNSTELTSF